MKSPRKTRRLLAYHYSFMYDPRETTKLLKSHHKKVAVSILHAGQLLKKHRLFMMHPHTGLRKRNSMLTLRVFGVGRRTVGRGRVRKGAAAAVSARRQRHLEVSPPPPTVRRRLIRSLDDVAAATKRRTTSRFTLYAA